MTVATLPQRLGMAPLAGEISSELGMDVTEVPEVRNEMFQPTGRRRPAPQPTTESGGANPAAPRMEQRAVTVAGVCART